MLVVTGLTPNSIGQMRLACTRVFAKKRLDTREGAGHLCSDVVVGIDGSYGFAVFCDSEGLYSEIYAYLATFNCRAYRVIVSAENQLCF